MQFGESANGSDVEIKVGEEFELSLPETRTAGYQWTLTGSVDPVCALVSQSFQPASGKTGGSGTHSWRFRTVAPGTCPLALAYQRSWKSGPEPAQTFAMKVRVRS
jgi:predicted secreted protein